MSTSKLENLYTEIQLLRNTVLKSYEKRRISEIESLMVYLLLKDGVSLRFVSKTLHPMDIGMKCDLIKQGLGELLKIESNEFRKTIIQDMLISIIKLKHLIDNEKTI